jgi:hypothetical protein
MRRVFSLIVGCFLAAGCAGPGTEFERSGEPALKLEVRRASTKEVEGWQAMTPPHGEYTLYVSPEVELSNEDVLSTGVHFAPIGKAASRWKAGAYTLAFSVVFFVIWRRSKQWGWGVGSAVAFLLGLGVLTHGLTSTSERFDQQGSWQVVIRFNDAGKKKLADVTASMVDAQKYPPNRRPYPSKQLAFLIDGELTFAWPVLEEVTDGLFSLVHSTHLTKGDDPEGLSEEYATRIAKGIAGL